MSMEVLKTPNTAIKFRIFLEDKKKGWVGQGKIKGEVKAWTCKDEKLLSAS